MFYSTKLRFLLYIALFDGEEAAVLRVAAHGVGVGRTDDNMIQQLHMNGTQNGKQTNGKFQILRRGLGLAAGMVVCQHNSAGVVSQNMFHQSALIHSGQVDAAAAYGVGLQDFGTAVQGDQVHLLGGFVP